jgi:DDE superfamily endonuclease
VLDGTVVGECMARHRCQEFLRFLKRLNRDIPQDLALHLVLDTYQTHKHPVVNRWLAHNPRFHLHFIPTCSSWLNFVERWLCEISDKAIRRAAFPTVPALIAAICGGIDDNNQQPQPFGCTATGDLIIAKANRGKAKLETLH